MPTRPPQARAAPRLAPAETPTPARRATSPLRPAAPTAADNVATATAAQPNPAATPQPQAGALARSATQTPLHGLATPAEPAASAPRMRTVQLPRADRHDRRITDVRPCTGRRDTAPPVGGPARAGDGGRRRISKATPAMSSGTVRCPAHGGRVAAGRHPAAGSSAAAAAAGPVASAASAAPGAATAPQIARRQADSPGRWPGCVGPGCHPRRHTAAPQVVAATGAEAVAAAAAGAAARGSARPPWRPRPKSSRMRPAWPAPGQARNPHWPPQEPRLNRARPVGHAPAARRRSSVAGRLVARLDRAPPRGDDGAESDNHRGRGGVARRRSAGRQQSAAALVCHRGAPANGRFYGDPQPAQSGGSSRQHHDADRPPGIASAAACRRPSIAPDAPPGPASPAPDPHRRRRVAGKRGKPGRGRTAPRRQPDRRTGPDGLVQGDYRLGRDRSRPQLGPRRPAADSPAMIASAAARAPRRPRRRRPVPPCRRKPRRRRRAAAGNQVPSASLQSQADATIALAAGTNRLTNWRPAPAPPDAGRCQLAAGPVTGTAGITEIDIRPAARCPKAKPAAAAAADNLR